MEIPILTAAIILRLLASVLAFRLIRLSRGWVAWTLIAIAVLLTAIRLFLTLWDHVFHLGRHAYGLEEHIVSLLVSILLVAGIYAIRPLFLAFHRSEEELRRAHAEAREQAAEAKEGRLFLEAIMKQIPEGVVIADAPDLRYRLVSRHTEEMSGLPEKAMVGKTLEEHLQMGYIYHPDGNTIARLDELPLTRAIRLGEAVQGEEWALGSADGKIVYIEANAGPIRDAKGEIVAAIVTFRDITERKERETERERLLEENRLRMAELEAIFEATQDGLILYGPKGEILRTNAATREFLGYESDEEKMDIAQRWELLRVEKMDGTPLPPEEIPVKRVLEGETVRTILHCQPPRRPARWFSVSAAPIRSVGSSEASAVTILTDITEIRELQQEQELFMQMISHDLRTPITVIQGHAELMIEHLSERDEMTELHLEAITAATRQLSGMMEDLSRMIQLERGHLPLDLEIIDVAEFTIRLADRMKVSGDGLEIGKSFPTDLPPLLADRVSLERILTNLITNAFKYSPADAPVKVSAEAVGEEMRISVHDRGRGIAPEDQPLVFERFFRARNAGGKKGVGLGLYITRKLVEAHGGRVWVESEPGKGSVFTISLPLRPPEDRQPGSKELLK